MTTQSEAHMVATIGSLITGARAVALDAIRAAAELAALALILMAGGLWAGISRGLI